MADSNSNNNNNYNEREDHILISSQANANTPDGTEVFQNFTITSLIWAKVVANNLEVSIDLNDCRAGPMLSNKWPFLHKLGIGYFLDSVEIEITPIRHESMPNKILYVIEGRPKPQNLNRDINMSVVHENKRGMEASNGGFVINYGKRNEQSSTSTTAEWELLVDGCGITGLGWRYQYSANSPFKNLDDRRRFAPGEHSCKWRTFEAMSGFRITITQVLRCEITDCWYNPIKRSKSRLKKLCPKMVHILEISFNSLENFNENFANLKNSEKLHGDFLNVTFSKNVSPQIEKSKNENIEIKRFFKKFEDKQRKQRQNK
ncbi:hypothetical protein Glove_658g27 [Diversispora epigaea]|uniref:Uncharacterized protein n=1 Tax=Diversispora epigaea TaxID=1348612 RepID=A0A397G6S5_9GLOM|nr:hypothetical protein Glove_658g27 [Diversispora epigaea]